MKYKINNIVYSPAQANSVQGIKGHQIFKFFRKKNIPEEFNSYSVTEPSKAIVSLTDENGNIHNVNVFQIIKDKLNTENYIANLNSKIQDVEFKIDEGKNLKLYLMQELKKYL